IFTAYSTHTGAMFDALLIKIDSVGTIVWQKYYGTPTGEFGACVRQTSDSGLILVGRHDQSASNRDVLLIKTNEYGDTLWTRCYGTPDHDLGYAVMQTTDGGYLVAYSSSGTVGTGGNSILKTDSFGNLQWSRCYGGLMQNNPGKDVMSVNYTRDGSYLFYTELYP